MSDLISRQAAIEYFMINTNWHDEEGYSIDDWDEKRKLLEDYFNGVPSAEPKTGKWVITSDNPFADTIHAKCSECKRHQIFYYGKQPTNYCPECGARMTDDD